MASIGDAQRRRLERLAEVRAGGAVTGVTVREQAEGFRAADRAVHGRRAAAADAATVRRVRGAVEGAQTAAARALVGHMDAVLRDARAEALAGLRQFVGRFDPAAAEVLAGRALRERVAGSAHASAGHRAVREHVARWAVEAREAVHRDVAAVVRGGGNLGDVHRAAQSAAEGERWRLDRIARTETAFAFNAAQDEAIAELARTALPRVMKRWTERVDDRTWAPLDNRVAADSLVLHGQVAPPGGVFTMPPDPTVPATMHGRTYDFPPNRPNDRAVVLPWAPGWDVPAWTFDGGSRRWLRR